MKRTSIICLSLFLSVATVNTAYAQKPVYRQAGKPIVERVADLLGRMTLDEKIAQLRCPLGWEMYTKTGKNSVKPSNKYVKMMSEAPIGSFWAVLRADPWTQKTLETGLHPRLAAQALNALQRFAVEKTRLGIPILFAEECPHGHMAIGTTVFPTSLCAASTWNSELMHRMGEAIGLEARSQGANIGYGPVLDVAREPRWSRMEETFGEDPWLTSVLGTEVVRGMQGDKPDASHVYCTLKHLAAYGIPESGHNGGAVYVGERVLRSQYLLPFEKAVKAGAATVMTSYNSIDGVPCSANRHLLTDILRGEWGFRGFVYSDLLSIDGIAGMRVSDGLAGSAALALKAGLDMDLGGGAYGGHLKECLDKGMITIADIDSAVSRVLTLKFRMGLFENPYVDEKRAAEVCHSDDHVALARQVAEEGTVLLKNNGVLPLSRSKIKRIAVIGPNADTPYNQLGDYTAPQPDGKVKTVLAGIKAAVAPETDVVYERGCAVRDTNKADIPAAVRAAHSADAVVLVVGGSSARDFKTKYISTGAATVDKNTVPDMDCGEGFDRSTLDLLGRQEQLIDAVAATGKPLIVVYIEGRTLLMNNASDKADALLTAWYPGEEGGNAIASILFGDANPSGRLPVSIPRSVGQLPVYYSQGHARDYVESPSSPLYPFGFGLSYTRFDYSGLAIKPLSARSDSVAVSLDVTNSGQRDGDEVVQLYLSDRVASVSQPPLQLRGFRRVSLKQGETKRVTFTLGFDELSLVGLDMRRVVEPGTFDVLVGASSEDIRLKGNFVVK